MVFTSAGSSPLARGTLELEDPRGAVSGLIPARAGNTDTRGICYSELRAHPRSRGEHTLDGVQVNGYSGSSPLARGTLCVVIELAHGVGLIPARAGNTQLDGSRCQPGGAHPRSRGEHRRVEGCIVFTAGSSPLARGTPANLIASKPKVGLIPARAGNTRVRPEPGGSARAHPRSRGEHCAGVPF